MKNQKSGKGWREDKQEVLTEKGIEQKAPIHRKVAMKDRYSNTLRTPFAACNAKGKDEEFADEVIETVQEMRKPGAIAKDNYKTAERVGDKEDLVGWIKEPEESDLEDVDDKSKKPKKDEDEDEEV